MENNKEDFLKKLQQNVVDKEESLKHFKEIMDIGIKNYSKKGNGKASQ